MQAEPHLFLPTSALARFIRVVVCVEDGGRRWLGCKGRDVGLCLSTRCHWAGGFLPVSLDSLCKQESLFSTEGSTRAPVTCCLAYGSSLKLWPMCC